MRLLGENLNGVEYYTDMINVCICICHIYHTFLKHEMTESQATIYELITKSVA